MRVLIRPTLFIIARLGLFLSVVAWMAAQLWIVGANAGQIAVGIDSIGLNMSADIRLPGLWAMTLQRVETANYSDVWFERLKRLPGFAARWRLENPWVIFKHWLIVTIFALLNGVLMWVYRKRGKELAADE